MKTTIVMVSVLMAACAYPTEGQTFGDVPSPTSTDVPVQVAPATYPSQKLATVAPTVMSPVLDSGNVVAVPDAGSDSLGSDGGHDAGVPGEAGRDVVTVVDAGDSGDAVVPVNK